MVNEQGCSCRIKARPSLSANAVKSRRATTKNIPIDKTPTAPSQRCEYRQYLLDLITSAFLP